MVAVPTGQSLMARVLSKEIEGQGSYMAVAEDHICSTLVARINQLGNLHEIHVLLFWRADPISVPRDNPNTVQKNAFASRKGVTNGHRIAWGQDFRRANRRITACKDCMPAQA